MAAIYGSTFANTVPANIGVAGGITYQVAPIPQQGTANTQANLSQLYSGLARTTTTAAVTILTIPLATTGTSCLLEMNVVGRDVSAGTVGDTVCFSNTLGFKNVAGTVTACSSQGTANKANDASMATCAVSVNISGTNLQIQVAGLLTVNIDWTAEVRAIIN